MGNDANQARRSATVEATQVEMLIVAVRNMFMCVTSRVQARSDACGPFHLIGTFHPFQIVNEEDTMVAKLSRPSGGVI